MLEKRLEINLNPLSGKVDDAQLIEMRKRNNPRNEPIGHYTGRCMRCGSNDLWDDAIHVKLFIIQSNLFNCNLLQ
jgi:hypothetical protein